MTEENKTEITPTKFDSWRIFPRLLITPVSYTHLRAHETP